MLSRRHAFEVVRQDVQFADALLVTYASPYGFRLMEQPDNARIARLLTEHLRWGSPKGELLPPILDNCWSAPSLSPELIDAKLARLYPFRWRLTIHVAGKQSAPDRASFALASRVLSELPKHIASIPNLDQWMLSAVAFPYQKGHPLWYAEFESEYGGDLEYAFRGSTDDSFSSFYVFAPEGLYESVPYRIGWLLDDLRQKSEIRDQELTQILERIEKEELFGTELIRPLMEILERNRAQFDLATWGWQKGKLDAIAKHAN